MPSKIPHQGYPALFAYREKKMTDITSFWLTDSWEVTDNELTFAPCGPPEHQPSLGEKVLEAAPNPKRRQSSAVMAKSETPKPSVVVPAPTFAPPESDSDFEMKEDDEEYTEERRRARKKNVSCNLGSFVLN
jgi:hypothetical protein